MPITAELTIPVTMYRYDELDAHAREKPRQDFIEHWIEDWWANELLDEYKAEGLEYGFGIEDIHYSGFHSQGDGACWVGHVGMLKFIDVFGGDSIGFEAWRCLFQSVWGGAANVGIYRSSSRFYHSETMCVETMDFNIEDFMHRGDTVTTDSILKGMTFDDAYKLIQADADCRYKTPESIQIWVLEEAKRYADVVYKKLYEAYEYECSDENIAEVYTCNDVYFNEKGGKVDNSLVEIYLQQNK